MNGSPSLIFRATLFIPRRAYIRTANRTARLRWAHPNLLISPFSNYSPVGEKRHMIRNSHPHHARATCPVFRAPDHRTLSAFEFAAGVAGGGSLGYVNG